MLVVIIIIIIIIHRTMFDCFFLFFTISLPSTYVSSQFACIFHTVQTPGMHQAGTAYTLLQQEQQQKQLVPGMCLIDLILVFVFLIFLIFGCWAKLVLFFFFFSLPWKLLAIQFFSIMFGCSCIFYAVFFFGGGH